MNCEQSLQETGIAEKSIQPFREILSRQGLRLERAETTTLQVNVGLVCNQQCRHCHFAAGPDRNEAMDARTAREVIAYAERGRFEIIDITGGAPELNPNTAMLIDRLSFLASKLMFRSNLTALNDEKGGDLMHLLKERKVNIVGSFPSLNEAQSDSQRGDGVFQRSINALRKLNALGYGIEGTKLELDLVSNPTGAFLPTPQSQQEKRFREVLRKKWDIVFNHLYGFANVPLGRFRQWLVNSGNLDGYVHRLASNFNACAVEGLMCRSLVSVSWDGHLYDCDFNLAGGLYMGGHRVHVSEMISRPEPGSPVAVAEHCYTCTAGAGFT
jgi:radical SAM/Cys-rich protein